MGKKHLSNYKLLAPEAPKSLPLTSYPIVQVDIVDGIEAVHIAPAFDAFVRFPEHSIKTIVRADIIEEHDNCAESFPIQLSHDMRVTKHIRRQLVPRQRQDQPCQQDCFIYSTDSDVGLWMFLLGGDAPYYHPKFSAINLHASLHDATLTVNVIPLPHGHPVQYPLCDNDREIRTCIHIAQRIITFALGHKNSYQKRVHHDILADKRTVQDTYKNLKTRYTWVLEEWRESTDPCKHVWEDVAIAAWLITIWKDLYTDGQAPGGFVDVACGNGLLVYILNNEGFRGYGFDMQRRKSWDDLFIPRGACLEQRCFSPDLASSLFPESCFLIGNHADELTPWIPVIAALVPGSMYANIPCCPYELTNVFRRPTYKITLPDGRLLLHDDPLLEAFHAPTPTDVPTISRYYAFMLYLCELSLHAGFLPEREALRIPSTKNHAILGRRRTRDIHESRAWAENVARSAQEKWSARPQVGRSH